MFFDKKPVCIATKPTGVRIVDPHYKNISQLTIVVQLLENNRSFDDQVL